MHRMKWIALVFLLVAKASLGQTSSPTLSPALMANSSALLLEYTRAIHVLEQGLRENWTEDKYLAAYDSAPDFGTAKEHLTIARSMVRAKMLPLSRARGVWDERPPLRVEVQSILEQCKEQRDSLLAIESEQSTARVQ